MANITGRGMLRGNITIIPVIDDTLTKKGQAAEAEATGKELAKKINYTDVVNSLESIETDKPLAAAQGKALDDKIRQAKQQTDADIKLVSDELDAFEQSTNSNLADHGEDIADNTAAIGQVNGRVDGIHFGKTFIYEGDGNTGDRVLATELDCNALLVYGDGNIHIIPKGGDGICVFGSKYNPGLTQTVVSSGGTLQGTALCIQPKKVSEGNTVWYEANDLLNRENFTYTCFAL